MTRKCQSRSEFGDCWLPGKHGGMHAVPIGPDFWFGYRRGGVAVGYGHFHDGEFHVSPCYCPGTAAAPDTWDEADYRRDGDQALAALADSIARYDRQEQGE